MKLSNFSDFVNRRLTEMAKYNQLPEVATPLDSTFISFMNNLPPNVRRLGAQWFWSVGLWEASRKRDLMAKEQGKNPEEITSGFGPEYMDINFRGALYRTYLKNPTTGESVVSHWANPNAKIDVYARLFKTMQEEVGRSGILGPDPKDINTNTPGHDLSGANYKYVPANIGKLKDKDEKGFRRKDGYPAHDSEELDITLPHTGLSTIDTVANKYQAMEFMATKKIAKKLEKEVEDKLRLVNFNISKLKVMNPNGEIVKAELKQKNLAKGQLRNSESTLHGIEKTFPSSFKLPLATKLVDWEQMKKEGWKVLHRPGYNDQENSFTAVRWNEDGMWEKKMLEANKDDNNYYELYSPIKIDSFDPITGNPKISPTEKTPEGIAEFQKSKGNFEKTGILGQKTEFVPFILPTKKGNPTSIDRPEDSGVSKQGFNTFGHYKFNSDDPRQILFEPKYQNALVNLWKTRPELFGDEHDGYGDNAPIRSIFKAMKADRNSVSDEKASYVNILDKISKNIRDPGFWLGNKYTQDDIDKMQDYVKNLIDFATGEASSPPQKDSQIENLLKQGTEWREIAAKSIIRYAGMGGKEKTYHSMDDEGNSKSIAIDRATSDFEGNRTDSRISDLSNDAFRRKRRRLSDPQRTEIEPEMMPERSDEKINIIKTSVDRNVFSRLKDSWQNINSENGVNDLYQTTTLIDKAINSLSKKTTDPQEIISNLIYSDPNAQEAMRTLDPNKLDELISKIEESLHFEVVKFVRSLQKNSQLVISLYKSKGILFARTIDKLNSLSNQHLYVAIPELEELSRTKPVQPIVPVQQPTAPTQSSKIKELMAARKAARQLPNISINDRPNISIKQEPEEFRKAESYSFFEWLKNR